jgi:hypothetical protein
MPFERVRLVDIKLSNAVMRKLVREIREIMPDASFEFTPCSKGHHANCIIQYQFMLVLCVNTIDMIFDIALYDLLQPYDMLAIVQLYDPLSLDAKFWAEQIKQYLIKMESHR